MGTTLKLTCGGCDAKAESKPFRKEFVSVSGRSYGLGSWRTPDIDDVVPEGWVWSDPYTACTYCPKCWEDIVRRDDAA